jgi:hypothetical protein
VSSNTPFASGTPNATGESAGTVIEVFGAGSGGADEADADGDADEDEADVDVPGEPVSVPLEEPDELAELLGTTEETGALAEDLAACTAAASALEPKAPHPVIDGDVIEVSVSGAPPLLTMTTRTGASEPTG